jgi:hypothetical protein
MFYRVLGFVVWQVGKWYLRRRAGAMLPSKRAAAAGLVGLAVVALAVQGARREGLTSS